MNESEMKNGTRHFIFPNERGGGRVVEASGTEKRFSRRTIMLPVCER